jgi:hypothetical protein
VRVRELATHFGALTYRFGAAGETSLRFDFDATSATPPGGFVVAPRCASPLRAVVADGREHRDFDAGSVRLTEVPHELVLRY